MMHGQKNVKLMTVRHNCQPGDLQTSWSRNGQPGDLQT